MAEEKAWEEVQKKTFTKWCNAHIVKKFGSAEAINNIKDDWQTGIKLMQLLNSLYGVDMPKHNKTPKMRPHKLDNIELAFRMLDAAGVKTNFLKPIHLIDSDQKMLLGMVWAIILDFQIKGISVDELTAKEGLLLWCKRKTAGYKDVEVTNFTTSWTSGLGFCALIHRHRPDLLDYSQLTRDNARHNLELAFDVAEKQLGIPRLLDVDDIVDVARPDERSIVTYLSEYFKCFSAQTGVEIAGRRLAKIVALEKSNDELKSDYLAKAQALVNWIDSNSGSLDNRDYDNTLEGIEAQYAAFNHYKKTVKPGKTNEKLAVETAYNALQAKLRINNRPPYVAPENLSPAAINGKWGVLGDKERARVDWIRKEIERQQRIEALASRFWRKAAALIKWTADNLEVVSSEDYGNSVAAVQAKLKNHEGFEANLRSAETRVDVVKKLGEQLRGDSYGKIDEVDAKLAEIDNGWAQVNQQSATRRQGLEAELARQQELESLRLAFATAARALVNYIEDAEDGELSEPVRVADIQAVAAARKSLDAFIQEVSSKQAEYDNLVQLNQQLVDAGITENAYTHFSIEQITERWNRLQEETQKRGAAVEQEASRQTENDNLSKRFAEKAAAFVSLVDKEKAAITNASSGELQAQLDAINQKASALTKHKHQVDELEQLNSQLDARSVTVNPYTEETIETIVAAWNDLNELAVKQRNLIEKAILAQSGSGISEDQLSEFKDTFRNFDKDNSGTLEPLEFKACLAALGHDISDEGLKALVAQLGQKTPGKIMFEEFVNYMISKTEDSDTLSSLKTALKTIANERDFLTEEDLRRVPGFDQDTIAYLLKTIPRNKEGNLDYNAFAENVYRA